MYKLKWFNCFNPFYCWSLINQGWFQSQFYFFSINIVQSLPKFKFHRSIPHSNRVKLLKIVKSVDTQCQIVSLSSIGAPIKSHMKCHCLTFKITCDSFHRIERKKKFGIISSSSSSSYLRRVDCKFLLQKGNWVAFQNKIDI